MHHSHMVQRLTASYYLFKTLACHFLRKPLLFVQQVLQGASIRVLQDTVIVALSPDYLLQADDMLTFDHLKEDEFSAKREHALLPVLRVSLSLLVDPVIACYFTRKYLAIKMELEDRSLCAFA